MENNPGDSSSESDISDPWSIVGPEEIPGENSGRDSISGEPSDGESLEVIDEEERHEEFTVKDVGMETDGISVITESEISDELEEPLPAAVSKDKKYLHHPNTFLNNSLTVLLVISCAGVAGLGLGHFLGLQEECPILNESTNNLITKLQQENDLLRKELYELHNAKRDYMQCKGWECGSKSNLKEIDASYKYLGLKSEIENNLQLENAIYAKDFPHHSGNEFAGKHNENIMNLVQDNRNIIDAEHKEQIDFDKVQKYTDDSNDLISIIEIKDQDDNLRNSPDDSSDLISIIQIKDQDDNLRNSVQQNADSLRFVGDVDIQDVKNNLLNKEDEQVRYIEESTVEENTNSKEELFQYDIFNNFMFNKLNEAIYKNVVLNNEKHSLEKDNAEAVEDKVYVYPSTEEDRVKTESQEKETSSEHVIETSDSFSQQSFIYPEKIPKHIVKEKNQWEENDLQQIKSTLELLKIHFHNDISPETGYVLSSAITLATEYEQDLAKLQETIANCKIKQSNFCIQFHKKMEVSVSKLKETSEELAEDIDEQMYKLLAKIARKLKKFKVNVQNKWCHLKNKYDNAEGWFQSSIFKDCKENNKQHEKMFSKTYETSHDAFKKDNIEENQNARKIIENSFKNSDIESSFKNENSQHREKKQEKVLKHKESHMKELYAKGEHRMHDKKYFQKKENKNEYKNNKCNERGNDKYCKENENKYSGSKKIKKHDHNNGNKEFKKNKVNNENEEKYNKQFITVDQSRTWPKFDSNSQKQNVSGDWILKMADDRAEQRKLNQRSDWLFDRADGRKVQRDRHHSTDNWYFERARGRDNCRYSAHSNCKSGPNYDWHQHRYERENEEKLHYGHRWTKKMIPRAFATAGKWMKDTFSKFENKFNYHSQH